jgi:RNA polymerase-binding protein DksA
VRRGLAKDGGREAAVEKNKLESFEKKLIKEKERLLEELRKIHDENAEASAAQETSGDQNFEDHMGDAATVMFDRERDFSLEQNLQDLLAQVEAALRRVEAGTYGICVRCGRPIGEARLRAIPYTDLCIEDKKKEEHQG